MLAFLSFLFRFAAIRATFVLNDKLIFELRNKLYNSMIRQNIGFHDQDKNGPGNLLSMLSKEMELIRPVRRPIIDHVVPPPPLPPPPT